MIWAFGILGVVLFTIYAMEHEKKNRPDYLKDKDYVKCSISWWGDYRDRVGGEVYLVIDPIEGLLIYQEDKRVSTIPFSQIEKGDQTWDWTNSQKKWMTPDSKRQLGIHLKRWGLITMKSPLNSNHIHHFDNFNANLNKQLRAHNGK